MTTLLPAQDIEVDVCVNGAPILVLFDVEAATDAKRTIESRMPRDGIEFFFGLPFGFVGATVHPPCITCIVEKSRRVQCC